jgi:REP element-mobilizing transposase RayT
MAKQFKQRLLLPKTEAVEGWHMRGYFPHFYGEGVTPHVCFHLFDSLPQQVLERWRDELKHLSPEDLNLERCQRMDAYLDRGAGSCFLREPALANFVQDALLRFDGQRYTLHAWCVMPNHVHTLFTPLKGFDVGGIAHSWKSFTANKCNQHLGRAGSFWHKEPFDRYIRNERHFLNAFQYIENNPVKAGLCEKPEDWLWSSALGTHAGCVRVTQPDDVEGTMGTHASCVRVTQPDDIDGTGLSPESRTQDACVPIRTQDACVPKKGNFS